MTYTPFRRKRTAAVAACIIVGLSPLQAVPQLAQWSQGSREPGMSVLWQRSVDPLLTLSLSPQGDYLALITADNRLALWSAQTGKSKWTVSGVTAHDVDVSDASGAVLIYDDMNRIDRRVSVYRASIPATSTPSPPQAKAKASQVTSLPINGKASPPPAKTAKKMLPIRPLRIFSRVLGGAVWDASISVDGRTAACVTGDRKLHLVSLGQEPDMITLPLDGIGNDLEFSGDNQYVAVGLWDSSGVETVDMVGRIRWSYLGAITRRYDVSVSPDSRRVLSISYRNPNHSAPVLTLLNDQAAVLWTYPLGETAYGATARMATNAEITYVSYTAVVRHYRTTVLERHLIALGPGGDVLWRQGGLFFKPILLFVTPDNNGIVAYDGIQTLYRIDQHGRVVRRDRLPGQLASWAVNHARTLLITYTSDGQLTAYSLK